MSNFTKGKWEVEHGAFDPEIICENEYLAFIYNLEHLEETEANARLIAAAPEMYNLLKSIASIDILKSYVETTQHNGKIYIGNSVFQDINTLLERIDGKK